MKKEEKLKIDITFLLNKIFDDYKDMEINLKEIIFDFMIKNNLNIKNRNEIQNEILNRKCEIFEKKEG